MTIRVGIVGASFAGKAYLPALRLVPDVEVAAIASARLERARAVASSFGISHAYDDWQQMLANHELDFVCIATPTDSHAPIAMAALEAGAHVLCEKPTALNAAEAKAMFDLAHDLGRVALLGHELRFNPNRRKIKKLVDSGAIGEVRHANIVNITPGWADPSSRPAGDWWSSAERGGGRLGANGSHQIDLLRWWFGEAKAVIGEAVVTIRDRIDRDTGVAWQATADDLTWMSLELTHAPIAQVFLSGVARHDMDNVTQLYGSEGTILLTNRDEKLLIAKPGGSFEDISEHDPNATLPGVGSGIWNVSYVALMQEACAAIRENRPARFAATFEDGWRNQQVIDAIRRSTIERRWIDLRT